MRTSLVPIIVLAASSAIGSADTPRSRRAPASLDVRSSAFGNNEAIPAEYTCDGAEVSPPLSWSKVPAGTKSIAILVDDPDAPRGTFTHWLVTGLPATTASLDKGAELPQRAIAHKNDKGSAGYAGPCPPGGRHRYQFRVYALDLTLPSEITRAQFVNTISGHVLATGQLVGTYQKRSR